jgi:hypothetical protein
LGRDFDSGVVGHVRGLEGAAQSDMSIVFKRLLHLYGSESVVIEKSAIEWTKLYRRFDRIEHARDFVAGHIQISTLTTCRESADLVRRDEGEGRTEVDVGLVHPAFPNYESLMRLHGMDPAIYKNTIISSSKGRFGLRDAWLLCMSTDAGSEANRRLGAFTVEISEPRSFFSELSMQMHAFGLSDQCLFGPIFYGSRTRNELDLALAPDPFIKPLSYSHEQEARFVWCHEKSISMKPRVLDFSRVTRYLKLLSG